jgi:hypothetical protein
MKINAVKSSFHAGFAAFVFQQLLAREDSRSAPMNLSLPWLTKIVEGLE